MFSEFNVDTCQCDMLTSKLNVLSFHFLPFSNTVLDVPVPYTTNYKHTTFSRIHAISEISMEEESIQKVKMCTTQCKTI